VKQSDEKLFWRFRGKTKTGVEIIITMPVADPKSDEAPWDVVIAEMRKAFNTLSPGHNDEWSFESRTVVVP